MKEQLDGLINRYGQGRKYSDIARRMAEIKLEAEKTSYSDREWLRRLRKEKKTYETYFSSYLATEDRKTKLRRPRANTLLLISQAIECDLEELKAIFFPQGHIPASNHQLSHQADSPLIHSNGTVENHIEHHHNLLTFVEEGDNSEADLLGEQFGFKCLKVAMTHIYYPDYSVEVIKKFTVLCLQDNLHILEDLDSCQFFAQEAARIDCPDERFTFLEKHYGDNGLIMSLKFREPLKQGQIIDNITLRYLCNKLDEGDNKFGSGRALHQTDWLTLDCTPPSLKYFRHATVLKYENREDYLSRKYGLELAHLSLGEAASFGIRIQNPTPYAYYGMYWG